MSPSFTAIPEVCPELGLEVPVSAIDKELRKLWEQDEARTHASRQQILAYSAGQRSLFTLPLAVRGTAFQQRVWRALLDIPPGTTCSYGELARQIGRPTAARAVGRANATNPICLIVPCHRVIGADGSLTGFAFGEKIKRRLLAHERRLVAESAVA